MIRRWMVRRRVSALSLGGIAGLGLASQTCRDYSGCYVERQVASGF
jgi:hypothetical protein